ncbi:MAG: hypothetical protein AAF970_12275, partial [Bacteroidota bacterium]
MSMTAALLAAGVALGLGVLIGRYLLAFLTQRTLGQARAEADRLRADAARTIEQERRTQVERPREEVDRARQALAQGREEAKRAALHVKQRLDQRQGDGGRLVNNHQLSLAQLGGILRLDVLDNLSVRLVEDIDAHNGLVEGRVGGLHQLIVGVLL